jgi:hypothetical protein
MRSPRASILGRSGRLIGWILDVKESCKTADYGPPGATPPGYSDLKQ